MKKSERLRQQKTKAVERMNALNELAKRESRELTNEEAAEFETLKREAEALNPQIDEAVREENTTPTQPAAPAAPDVAQLKQEAVLAERLRVNTIDAHLATGKKLGLGEDEVAKLRKELVDGNVTTDEAGTKVFAALAARDASQAPTREHHTGKIVRDEAETRREAMENALLHRHSPDKYKLEAGREFVGYSLQELARECVEATGKSTRGMNRDQVAQLGLHTTSDFPGILENVARKTLRSAYEAAPQTFRLIAQRMTLTDFKAANLVMLGEMPTLEQVNEAGEFTYGTLTESKSTIQLRTYGRIVAITRQVIINDDIGAFTNVPARFGNSVANKESDIVWGLITANANMADNVPIFHANHKNLGTAAALGVDPVGAGRAAMAKQVGLDKRTILNVRPKFLVVPASLETAAEQFLSGNFVPTTVATSIPQTLRSLIPIGEPRLDSNSTTAWYLFADPNSVDAALVYAYLDGQEGPYTETQQGYDIDGVKFKCRIDFGAAVGDYRAMYKNPGV